MEHSHGSKQRHGLIFTDAMQCTVNKRAERPEEEETAKSAVDSERQLGVDLSVEPAERVGAPGE